MRSKPFDVRRANPVGSLKLLRSHPELFGLAAVLFLMNLAHFVLPAVAVLYMGIHPKPFTDVMNPSVANFLKHVAISKL